MTSSTTGCCKARRRWRDTPRWSRRSFSTPVLDAPRPRYEPMSTSVDKRPFLDNPAHGPPSSSTGPRPRLGPILCSHARRLLQDRLGTPGAPTAPDSNERSGLACGEEQDARLLGRGETPALTRSRYSARSVATRSRSFPCDSRAQRHRRCCSPIHLRKLRGLAPGSATAGEQQGGSEDACRVAAHGRRRRAGRSCVCRGRRRRSSGALAGALTGVMLRARIVVQIQSRKGSLCRGTSRAATSRRVPAS
jgi:hypothetical protein